MSAMFAFSVGDVSMRSATFEKVMTSLLGRSSDPVDRQVCEDALELNCFWVDQVEDSRKCAVLVSLRSLLGEQLRFGVYGDNEVAVLEVTRLLDELERRYSNCFR